MDLWLGLSLSGSSASCDINFDLNVEEDDQEIKINNLGSVKKRRFDEAFDHESIKSDEHQTLQTLPLLSWNNNDINLEQEVNEVINQEKYLETENTTSGVDYGGVVGWPPTNSWRRKTTTTTGNHQINGHRRKNSVFVKVKMEGVGIARKVDILLHHSSHTLLQSLLTMFGRCQESIHAYKLLFQDKEGFWHLAEDVPWGNLIQSVNRLQLRRKCY